MIELDYSASSCLNDAFRALEAGDALSIRVRGRKAPRADRAVRAWQQYHSVKLARAKSYRLLFKLFWYGLAWSTLIAVLNNAELEKRVISAVMDGDDFVMTVL